LTIDLVLVNCPVWSVTEPPLGLAYIASYLKNEGYSVEIIDLNIEAYSADSSLKHLWKDTHPYDLRIPNVFKKLIDTALIKIVNSAPLLVGLSVNQYNLAASVELGKLLREKKFKVIFGGPECFLKPDRDQIPQNAADYYIAYDGELVLKQMLISIKSKQNLEEISGVIPSSWGDVSSLEYVPQIAPLSDIPMPTFDEFNLNLYTEQALPVMLSRGCSRRCVFCNDRSYHHSFRTVDVDSFIDGIQRYIIEYGTYAFSFHDAAINSDMNLCKSFCTKIIDKQLGFSWRSNAFIHKGLTKNMFELFRRSGCEALIFGIESMADSVLKKMKKGFNQQTAKNLIKNCKEAGIEVIINLIVGFPGERELELNETISFLRQNHQFIDKVLNLSTCFVAPKSDLEVCPEKYGIVLVENHFYQWYTKDGNTNQIRIDRLKHVKNVLDELGIPCNTTNFIKNDEKIIKLSGKEKNRKI
jgi:anaerobic magnesium-protoporphyrin IX monomethyl ester cyclase